MGGDESLEIGLWEDGSLVRGFGTGYLSKGEKRQEAFN